MTKERVGPSLGSTACDSRIALVFCSGRVFGQGLKAWVSLDIGLLRSRLESHAFDVSEFSFEELAQNPTLVRNQWVFYSSTQRPGYKEYLEDVLLALTHGGNVLVPSFDMFRAHENKGYQEILKRLHKLDEVAGDYLSSASELSDARWNDWPAVLKWPEGAKSTGVELVSSRAEAATLIGRRERLPLASRLRAFLRARLAPKPGSAEWYEYIRPRQRFVLQQFIPGLSRDFKVLVFGSRYYVLERKVRSNDFRASGSGKFKFIDTPVELLDYAAEVFNRLGEPFLSMDICETSNGFGLLEFQGIHAGPLTLVQSPFHYQRLDAGTWEKVDGPAVLEENYADAIAVWARKRCKAQ